MYFDFEVFILGFVYSYQRITDLILGPIPYFEYRYSLWIIHICDHITIFVNFSYDTSAVIAKMSWCDYLSSLGSVASQNSFSGFCMILAPAPLENEK